MMWRTIFLVFWAILSSEVCALGRIPQTIQNDQSIIHKDFEIKDKVNNISSLDPFSGCATNQYPPPAEDKISQYVINLDLDPEHRWDELMADKKDAALALLNNFKNISNFILNGKLFQWVDKYLPYLAKTLPAPYYAELQGLARAANISLGEITLYNLFYEVFTVCTSIVAQDEHGKLYHARNLDFGLLLGWDLVNHTWLTTEILRPLVAEFDFQKGGKTLFKTVGFAGYIGALTGIRPKLFTLTLDERFGLDGGFVGIIRWLMGDRSAHWAGFLVRDVLESATDYHDAVAILRNAPLLAPMYFIVGGNTSDEGCVITRGRNDADVWYLGTGSLSQKSHWYLVETNYDHWKQPPFFDDRRTPAISCLDEVGQTRITKEAIYNVLSTRPVLNKVKNNIL